MIKRILVFEFITGGGLSEQTLPPSLANEGMLMLNALLRELAELPSIQLTVLQDVRCRQLQLPENAQVISVSNKQSINTLLATLIDKTDAVWLIAPEIDSILKNISQLVEEKSKILLNSSSKAVALCSDKLSTYKYLNQQGIAVVNTAQMDTFLDDFDKPWVVKLKEGAGCLDSYYIATENELKQLNTQLKQATDYIIQPYIKGEPLSLSCLFKQGRAWLLCCNRQQISIVQGQFQLSACEVNIVHDKQALFQQLIEKVAKAIPGLWGYVGIDIIQTESGKSLVLEINPRLTTSYVGIRPALGINVAKLIIEMIDDQPMIIKKLNKQITVSIV